MVWYSIVLDTFSGMCVKKVIVVDKAKLILGLHRNMTLFRVISPECVCSTFCIITINAVNQASWGKKTLFLALLSFNINNLCYPGFRWQTKANYFATNMITGFSQSKFPHCTINICHTRMIQDIKLLRWENKGAVISVATGYEGVMSAETE